MIRRLSPFILVVAVLIAVEPLVHHHPLETNATGASANTACAICATGPGRVTTIVVVAGVPQILTFAHVNFAPAIVALDAPLPRSPRAPPAA